MVLFLPNTQVHQKSASLSVLSAFACASTTSNHKGLRPRRQRKIDRRTPCRTVCLMYTIIGQLSFLRRAQARAPSDYALLTSKSRSACIDISATWARRRKSCDARWPNVYLHRQRQIAEASQPGDPKSISKFGRIHRMPSFSDSPSSPGKICRQRSVIGDSGSLKRESARRQTRTRADMTSQQCICCSAKLSPNRTLLSVSEAVDRPTSLAGDTSKASPDSRTQLQCLLLLIDMKLGSIVRTQPTQKLVTLSPSARRLRLGRLTSATDSTVMRTLVARAHRDETTGVLPRLSSVSRVVTRPSKLPSETRAGRPRLCPLLDVKRPRDSPAHLILRPKNTWTAPTRSHRLSA